MRRDRTSRRGARRNRRGARRPERRRDGRRPDGQDSARPCQSGNRALQISARGRLHRRVAQDADGQDSTLSPEGGEPAVTDFAATKTRFHLPPGVVYLDGNSLGPPPRAAMASAERVLGEEWGGMLIR